MKTLWKSMKAGLKSAHGDTKWQVGDWYHCEGKIKACKNGFHASENIIDAMGYVNCEVLCLVEVKGSHDDEDDKSAYEYMRIKKAWHWKKEDSVALSIFAAELCLKNFEKVYPDDKRPREAIEAAKKWLEEPTEVNQSAAMSAEAAEAAEAEAAEAAARSAEAAARSAWSAEAAAWSARSAEAAMSAEAAAEAAEAAARSAEAAARSAVSSTRAKKKILKQCHEFVAKRIETLEEYKNV